MVIIMVVVVRMPMMVPMIMVVRVLVPGCMAMIMTVAAIGTAGRIERGGNIFDSGTKSLQHCLDDVIAQDENLFRSNGGWQMAVANVPGQFHQMPGIACTHGVKFFFGGNYFHHCAVFQYQPVTICQHDWFWQVYQHLVAIGERDRLAPQMALVMTEQGGSTQFDRTCRVVCGMGLDRRRA